MNEQPQEKGQKFFLCQFSLKYPKVSFKSKMSSNNESRNCPHKLNSANSAHGNRPLIIIRLNLGMFFSYFSKTANNTKKKYQSSIYNNRNSPSEL